MNSDHAAERESCLREEKRKVKEEIRKAYADQTEKNKKKAKRARNESKLLVKKKKEELIEARARQAREIAELEAQLEAACKEKIVESTKEGKLEVRKRSEEFETLQKELDEKTRINRELLNASSEFVKKIEKVRQEALEELKKARKANQVAFNAKMLEISEKKNEARMIKEELLQISDKNRFDEEKKKEEKTILTAMVNLEDRLNSLVLETNFKAFKQECSNLRSKHRRFCVKYYGIASELFTIYETMKIGRSIEYYDLDGMEGFRSALRVFRYAVMAFNCAGSTAEIEFQIKIENLIDLLMSLESIFNKIESEIESYEDEENAKSEVGIGDLLLKAETLMKKVELLIHQFKVIGKDHLRNWALIEEMLREAAENSMRRKIENETMKEVFEQMQKDLDEQIETRLQCLQTLEY